MVSVMQAESAAPTLYFEVDFKEVTKRKAAVIANRDVLHQMVSGKVSPQDIVTCVTFCSIGPKIVSLPLVTASLVVCTGRVALSLC